MSAEYKRQWYLKNKERCQAKRRQWYLANKERILAQEAERYEEKKEYIKARVKAHTEANKQEIYAKRNASNKSSGAIKKKLLRHREEDIEKGREFNLTYDYVIDLLNDQGGECAHCDVTVKRSWTTAYDSKQFSINRIKNRKGHIEGNVEICCLQCNREYRSK